MVFIYWMLIPEVHFRCYGKGKLTEVFLSVTTNVLFKPQSHQVLHVSDCFNVRSGQQLSVLNIGSQLTDLTSSPQNGLIAICEKNTNHNFRVIRLRLSGDNKEKRIIKGQLSI